MPVSDHATAAVGSLFREMGSMVERAWIEADRDERALPAIAERAFDVFKPERDITLTNLAHWLCAQRTLGSQLDGSFSFGQPPITVFDAHNLVIDVYVWRDF